MHLQLACWRRGVNPFSQAHKGNPEHLELVGDRQVQRLVRRHFGLSTSPLCLKTL